MFTKKHLLPKVLVNSVPKSGTHLLMQVILGIPGMTITPTWYYPSTYKDIKNMKLGQVGPAHLHYSPEIAKQIHKWGTRVVFISRDLRDIAVSLVHFVMENKWGNHPFHSYLQHHCKTDEERLLAVIQGVAPSKENKRKYGIAAWPNIYQYTCKQYGWLQAPNICRITFEDCVRDEKSQNQSLMKVIQFLWEDLKHQQLTKLQLLQHMKQNINPATSGTFRRGKIGGWKEEFTQAHKQAFKEVAGDFLIKLGYEEGYNW